MKPLFRLSGVCLTLMALSGTAAAATEIQWWHAMTGTLGDRLNTLADRFNKSQPDYKIVPVFKGSYPETLAASIAAFRAGSAPHIVQVFEVGTATMMASKGAIVPVEKIMKDAGEKFDRAAYVPAVAGFYTTRQGEMLSFPFNSSTTVFYFNKDALAAAGVSKPPETWPEVAAAAPGAPSQPAALVLGRLPPGTQALAAPPSFDSCTRDVYDDALQFSPATVLAWARQVAGAMAQLHARGLVHGDLYAHNLLRAGQRLWLSDLGAASFLPPDQADLHTRLRALDGRAYGVLLGEWLARCTAPQAPELSALRAWRDASQASDTAAPFDFAKLHDSLAF